MTSHITKLETLDMSFTSMYSSQISTTILNDKIIAHVSKSREITIIM